MSPFRPGSQSTMRSFLDARLWCSASSLCLPIFSLFLLAAIVNARQENPSARCTSNSTFASCLFQPACLEAESNQAIWTTETLPYHNWLGVSKNVQRMGSNDFGQFDGCDNPFLPKIIKDNHDDTPFVSLSGTYLYLCVWIHHFGHNLMDHLYPAFDLIQAMAKNNTGVTLLIDPRIKTEVSTPSLTMDILSVLGTVRSVQEVSQWAESIGMKRVCFERFLVGMKRTGVTSHQDIPEGGYSMMRDFVYNRLGIKNSREGCKFMLVKRSGSRAISNAEVLLQELRSLLPGHCTIEHTDFSGAFADQIRHVASLNGIISVASSGSHQMMWLPDGAFSLVIEHPFHADTNRKVCENVQNVLCLRAPSNISDAAAAAPHSLSERMALPLIADVEEVLRQFRIGLSWQSKIKKIL